MIEQLLGVGRVRGRIEEVVEIRPGVRIVLVGCALQAIAQLGRDDATQIRVVRSAQHATRIAVPQVQGDQRVTAATQGAIRFERLVAIGAGVHGRVRRVRFQGAFQPGDGAFAGRIQRRFARLDQRALRGRTQISARGLHGARAARGLREARHCVQVRFDLVTLRTFGQLVAQHAVQRERVAFLAQARDPRTRRR